MKVMTVAGNSPSTSMPSLLEIRDRITELLAAGWKRVRVVTDHGWLLLPGGLPKIDLAQRPGGQQMGTLRVFETGSLHRGTALSLVLESESVLCPG